VFSWVNPRAPLAEVFNTMTRPLLRPFRRFIPPVGGVDLSPLALLLVLQIALFVVAGHAQQRAANDVAAMSWLLADGTGVTLRLHIQPGAKKTEVARPAWRSTENPPRCTAGRRQGQRLPDRVSCRTPRCRESRGQAGQRRELASQARAHRRR
jgi:uncharacterized protein YggT (Ycf19 family)